MSNKRLVTKDGSHTLYVEELDETYHSRHGAIQESQHVFIEAGLKSILKNQPSVKLLELGFGTGLNAWLTALYAPASSQVEYHTIEKYPVAQSDALSLNFPKQLSEKNAEQLFKQITECVWEEKQNITPNFSIVKRKGDFLELEFETGYNLIYWDVFGYRAQPHLWSELLFQKVYDAMAIGGCLVTYSSKGVVRRTMQQIGFDVEKLPGPPGKREMIRAWKK